MFRTPAIVASVSCAALLLSGCGGDSEPAAGGSNSTEAGGELETVRVIHVPTTLFAPLYVADARGYFADEGLELQLETVQAGQDAIPLTAAGRADVLVAGFGSGLFSAVNDGLEIRVVGSMGGGGGEPDNSPTKLMVSSELEASGEVDDVADLEGRTVALSGGLAGAGAYQLAAILAENDLDLTDIEAVNVGFGDMAGAISSGSVDAALPPAPFTTAMEQEGVAVPLALPPAGTIASGVIYNEDFLETPAAQGFFNALVRASADLNEDPKTPEILEILADATGQDLAVLESEASYVWLPNLEPVPGQLEAQQEAYRAADLFDFEESVPVEELIDDTFAENAG